MRVAPRSRNVWLGDRKLEREEVFGARSASDSRKRPLGERKLEGASARRGGLVGAVAGLVLLAGCGGGPPADLFTVARSGDIPGARLTLRITDDGRVSCNDGELVQIPSADTIAARQARRDLEGEEPEDVGPADENTSLPPGPGSILRYVVRAEAGTVSFSDNSARQPQVFRELAALTRRLAKGPCGLVR